MLWTDLIYLTGGPMLAGKSNANTDFYSALSLSRYKMLPEAASWLRSTFARQACQICLGVQAKAIRADIVPGGTFPDYELTDHTKTRGRLNDLQGVDPMILVLSHENFCPNTGKHRRRAARRGRLWRHSKCRR